MPQGVSHDVVFEFVDLADSIVLSWTYESDRFRVRLDVSLLPDHPNAGRPKPGERASFHPGELEFAEVSQIEGLLPQSAVQSSKDPDGEPDYDTVHRLQTDGERRYYLEGEFGEVWIDADTPVIRLQDSEWTCAGRITGV